MIFFVVGGARWHRGGSFGVLPCHVVACMFRIRPSFVERDRFCVDFIQVVHLPRGPILIRVFGEDVIYCSQTCEGCPLLFRYVRVSVFAGLQAKSCRARISPRSVRRLKGFVRLVFARRRASLYSSQVVDAGHGEALLVHVHVREPWFVRAGKRPILSGPFLAVGESPLAFGPSRRAGCRSGQRRCGRASAQWRGVGGAGRSLADSVGYHGV